ncbi:MAG: phosphatidylglycerol lysyltransferase domain-containing protein [Candidatus Faecousia sp.]|nr:phosphatidylglycerol lysyltransferase domain-containing protein [Bacillota bacterium]MDY4220661.1 phosphatidylglycerol lysyltransferase domain-containing protein [Candidatus Faecousia sp.]
MIPFRRLELSMREEVSQCFYRARRQGCEYSFTNLYLWGRQQAAWLDGYLVMFSHFYGHSMYPFPAGQGPLKPVLEALGQDARERGIPFRLTSMSGEDCRVVEELFPGQFQFCPDRDSFDYIYEIDHLADLKGKQNQQKRNHINRFLEACPNWRAVDISRENLPDCQALAERWYRLHMEADPHMNYHLEQLALSRALRHYEALNLEGILLLDGDRPIAMTIGSRLSEDTFDVHFEKAFGDIPGDYAMVNRTFARTLRQRHPELRYLNREDDMGLPGLRKAKESYHPDKLLEQYWCVLREDLDEN